MTELIGDGKYVDGKRQGLVRVALPFQTIETVNESAADRRRNLELFSSGRETGLAEPFPAVGRLIADTWLPPPLIRK